MVPRFSPVRLLSSLALALLFALPAQASEAAKAGDNTAAKREFETVGFELLAAFNYVPPGYEATSATPRQADVKDNQIPDYVRELDQKKISITGFMLPTKFKDGKVTEFLLMKDQSGCCFGAMPRINEWIIVKMTQGGVPPLMDMPLTFVGKLKVGEVFEEGYLAGIYQLDGEKLLDVKG